MVEPDTPQAVHTRLHHSFHSGKTRSLDWRREQLHALIRMFTEQRDALLDAMFQDYRKSKKESNLTEIDFCLMEFEHCLAHLDEWTEPEYPSVGVFVEPGKGQIISEPLGTVLVIAPWNFPVQLLMAPVAQAISGGNCVCMKPSELTPHTSAALAAIVPQYLDPECLIICEGTSTLFWIASCVGWRAQTTE